LYHRDIPLVRESLATPSVVALLKGRANYLCVDRYQRTRLLGKDLTATHREQLTRIDTWVAGTSTGEIAEATNIPEEASIWHMVTSTNDNCLGAKCDFFDKCYVNRARKAALAADVLVINHHLFFADLALREDGFGKLLPGAECVIFDEAHQLPAVASNFLGNSISGNQLLELCRDVRAEERREKSQHQLLEPRLHQLERRTLEIRPVFDGSGKRIEWHDLCQRSGFQLMLTKILAAMEDLNDVLQEAAVAGEGLARCWSRSVDLHDRLCELTEDPHGGNSIRWAESTTRTFRIQETPVDIGQTLRSCLHDPERSWIFTSATLSIAGDFGHYQRQIGVDDVDARLWDSPFDYEKQALLFVPEDMPDPRHPAFTRSLMDRAMPVLEASEGRAFMLFTSYRAMHEAAEILSQRDDFEILVQGAMPKSKLLDRFRKQDRALLLGTSSFWEGVDVRGDALACVIIDKLPFEAPDDPVLRARSRAIEEAGGNPFLDYQLPNAVLTLRQGIGRLIRDVTDRGILMLCDPRLFSKSYGKLFLRSLPPIPITRDLRSVEEFLQDAA
jgi:ATP-dependent DNA helicase DinG